jgi:hypothetical protein
VAHRNARQGYKKCIVIGIIIIITECVDDRWMRNIDGCPIYLIFEIAVCDFKFLLTFEIG